MWHRLLNIYSEPYHLLVMCQPNISLPLQPPHPHPNPHKSQHFVIISLEGMFHFEGAAVTRRKAPALKLLLSLRLFKPSLNAANMRRYNSLWFI